MHDAGIPLDGGPAHSNVAIVLGSDRPLSSVDRSTTLQLLRKHGSVLFRGFAHDVDGFVALTERFCDHFLEHGSVKLRPRRSGDGTVAEVVVGNDAVSLHGEMNYSPLRPDTLWFYCSKPAASGGETLVADSRQVLAALAPATREVFEKRRIRYRHLIDADIWQRMTKITEREEALAVINMIPDTAASGIDDNRIQFDFVTDAIQPIGDAAQPGFLNSIENMFQYAEHGNISVTFEDGQTIDPAILTDIARAGSSCAQPVAWQPGDILMVDNTCMLHGRNAFPEGERKIDVRFGMRASD
jgi:alpha-ketoglutarate-dependent taurine dioxygenase